MKGTKTLVGALSVAAVVAGFAMGSAQAETKIVGGEIATSLTGQPGDAVAGKKTAINRKLGNCLACHAVTVLSSEPYHGEVGPSLDGVANRYNEGQLRAILVDSKQVFEGTMMPAFHRATGYNRVAKKFKDKTILSAQQVEDVLAFLQTLNEE